MSLAYAKSHCRQRAAARWVTLEFTDSRRSYSHLLYGSVAKYLVSDRFACLNHRRAGLSPDRLLDRVAAPASRGAQPFLHEPGDKGEPGIPGAGPEALALIGIPATTTVTDSVRQQRADTTHDANSGSGCRSSTLLDGAMQIIQISVPSEGPAWALVPLPVAVSMSCL